MNHSNSHKAVTVMRSITHATIATSDASGMPWNSPVYFAYDLAGHIYWSSHPGSQHSTNIDSNGRAFIVVYDSMSKNCDGLYMECSAQRLDNEDDIRVGLWLLGNRRKKPFQDAGTFMMSGTQRIYRATAERVWLNNADKDDAGAFVKDYRVSVPVEDFIAALQ